MDFFKNLSDAMLGAKDFVLEKNRKSALANRLRAVVKCEEQSAERAYLALGRYYYHNLRDASNPITEPNCIEIDAAEKRLDQAVAHLEKIYSEGDRDSVVEKVTLDDVEEINPIVDAVIETATDESDAAVEGVLDEGVEAVTEEIAAEEENKELPFEG